MRSHMLNLTHKSIKHFVPNAKFFCWSFYDKTPAEYDSHEPLDPDIENTFVKTLYPNTTGLPTDNIWNTDPNFKTSGYANFDNIKFFVEGFNLMFEKFKNIDEKVFMLGEDCYFTNGQVLKEIQENDFDLAYAPWEHISGLDVNACFVCIKPANVKHCFPLDPRQERPGITIETKLGYDLVQKISKVYKIKNRKGRNYFGDGSYTNSSLKIEEDLKAVGILK